MFNFLFGFCLVESTVLSLRMAGTLMEGTFYLTRPVRICSSFISSISELVSESLDVAPLEKIVEKTFLPEAETSLTDSISVSLTELSPLVRLLSKPVDSFMLFVDIRLRTLLVFLREGVS